MNVIVNVFILAFVNGAFSQFNFVQDSGRFPSSLPGEKTKAKLKHTVNSLAVVCQKDAGREVCATRFTFDQNET